MKQSAKRFRASGFTLIEVMISLTIMAMITTVAFTGLSISLDSWRRGTNKIEDLEGRATVERLLRSQLALAYPLEFRLGEQQSVLFRGTGDQVEFIADFSLIDGPSDFRKIGYLFDGAVFRYEEKTLFGYVPSQQEQIAGDSLAKVSALHFRYLAAKDDKREWLEEWHFGQGLPLAVEIRIDKDVLNIPLVNRQ